MCVPDAIGALWIYYVVSPQHWALSTGGGGELRRRVTASRELEEYRLWFLWK